MQPWGHAVFYSKMSTTQKTAQNLLENALSHLRSQLPDVTFVADNSFRWDPANQRLHYLDSNNPEQTIMMLLHEAGHALAGHACFKNDLDLLIKEVEAWSKAKVTAKQIDMEIDETTVENCLDSYRHWLDKRSTCPNCSASGYQDEDNCYRCFNCTSRWWVGADQTTRVCRITAKV